MPYLANTTTGNLISWAATLAYQTSGGYGITFNTLPGFATANGVTHNETYQSEGGQVQVTASTTASDGSSLQDCVTFYIDGPQAGIPNTTITGQLDSLYQHSQSYPTDGTATPSLMTGIAERESTYTQFRTHAECNADLFNLYANYGVLAKWPFETELTGCISDGGTHIGLMQVVTATNQTTDPNAWKWADPTPAAAANTNDAVNLFSGTVSPNKMGLASTYANNIIKDPRSKPPIDGYYQLNSPNGQGLENMALVLYGGYLEDACGPNPSEQCKLDSEYYIPSCSGTQGTISQKGQTYLTCSTGWTWAVNTTNQPGGVAYVSNSSGSGVRNQLQH